VLDSSGRVYNIYKHRTPFTVPSMLYFARGSQ
jgi:hypothetical protein